MATVSYDDRSFSIDGQRIWLVSGSLHYFRVPSGLWADRLLKAKRAGLNCISTYVAWNYHEPAEGQWNVSGRKDILEFVHLAAELGLYVILRPGPYICAEWDFGGLPAWLSAKGGINYRGNNAAYTHYFDKYFAQILPRLSECQVTHGGNIILIQNENEYTMTTQPDRTAYLDFITQLFRRSGFTIPIINCNHFTDPPVEGTVECVNAYNDVTVKLKQMRLRQPNAPLVVTEFYSGWFDCWGQDHHEQDGCTVARKAMEVLGCGSQMNYYMWHGGTNFGFWGSRQANVADRWLTTSYDYDAPLAEGGGLTRKYYLTRLVNLLADSMGEYFASSHADEPGAGIVDATDVTNLTGPMGRWAFVTNNGRDEIETVKLSLPSAKSPGGLNLEVSLETLGAAAVPFELKLPGGKILDYCSLTPLGLFGGEGRSTLILHAPAETDGVLSINGDEIPLTIPADDVPEILEHHELTIVLLDSELAMRTWPMNNCILFGPAYVGKDLDEVQLLPRADGYHVLSLENRKLTRQKVRPETAHKPAAPRLGNWKRICICPESISDKLDWKKLDRPRDMDKLGMHYGYGWYRIDVEMPRACKKHLYLPNCGDRASLYCNGSLAGIWGLGQGATRQPITVDFKKGANKLVAMVDNLGRFCSGDRMGESKGIWGHIYEAKALRIGKFKIKPCESFPKRIVPRTLSHLLPELEAGPTISAELALPLTKVLPIQMTFENIPHHVAVLCNDRPAGFFSKMETNWADITLGADLKKGKNVISLLLWGDVAAKTLDNVTFHTLIEPISAGMQWSYRPWTLPGDSAPEPIKGKGCWYTTKFRNPRLNIPLFLRISGAKKGQIYLNGRNAGRFWTIGPQELYYLPSSWMGKENELLLFEEHGNMPSRSKLEYCPHGPFES